MTFRASVVSLMESEVSIDQGGRTKKLTQLAFIFILLSLVTSIFSMNISILKSGETKVWVVLVTAVIVYTIAYFFGASLRPIQHSDFSKRRLWMFIGSVRARKGGKG